MRLLLDTHVLVWWLTDAADLSADMALIKARENTVFVSAASCWEIAIKVRSGKWTEAAGLVPGIADVLSKAKLMPLAVTVQHTERAGLLDFAHKDPFDRLLAAQALEENLTMAIVIQYSGSSRIHCRVSLRLGQARKRMTTPYKFICWVALVDPGTLGRT